MLEKVVSTLGKSIISKTAIMVCNEWVHWHYKSFNIRQNEF